MIDQPRRNEPTRGQLPSSEIPCRPEGASLRDETSDNGGYGEERGKLVEAAMTQSGEDNRGPERSK